MIATVAQLMLWAVVIADSAPPLLFAGAGTAVRVPVAAADETDVVLFVLGKQLDGRFRVSTGRVTFEAPAVRVRTIFELQAQDIERPLARVVVYPSSATPWPPDTLELLVCGAPQWFEQWARAVGASIRIFATAQELRQSERGTSEHRLIVLGHQADLADLAATRALARTCATQVVILEAPWFHEIAPVDAVPKLDEALPPLPRLATWTWRDLPTFQGAAQPDMAWSNRAAIVSDDARVWVELFIQPNEPQIIFASYLPWVQHLGQNDSVDALFAAILLESARAETPAPFDRRALIHGADGPFPRSDRPVLSRLAHAPHTSTDVPLLHIVDLRGPQPSTLTARTIQPLLDNAATNPVLILGDDSALRSVRHLPEPGLPKKLPAEIIWLADDRNDAAQEQQECLLRIATAYHVPVIDPLSENER